jgi:CheY-like chemotaxis protein
VGNAIKFTAKGRVAVTIRATRDGTEPRHLTLDFFVADTGIGLSEEQKLRLFEPFMQADESMSRRFGGTGLGLYLSRRLAGLLGGDLALLESSIGRGSTFRVSIQAKAVTAPAVDCKAPSSTGVTLEGAEVLLVEDSVDNQVLVGRVLLNSGAKVDMATNGFDAVEMALAKDYDIVLMDIQMPRLDGLEATEQLRKRGYKRPIVALTAHAMKSDRQRCIEIGCNDYLSKPFESKALIDKVALHLRNP